MPEHSRTTLPLKINAGAATDIGRGRRHNEDNVLIRPDLHLYVLADGAGGHNAGNVASALATTSIANFIESSQPTPSQDYDIDEFGLPLAARRLAVAIQGANRDIIEIARTSNKRKGMGSTVVAALVSLYTAEIHVAHVGDSRCYRLRDGHLEQLSHDHSLLNDVLELKPDMDATALARLPRNVVTRALGMEDPVRVSVRTYKLVTGDRYLMCSDGLTDALADNEISEVLRLPKTPDELVRLFIDLANEKNEQDNIAAVVVVCEAAPAVPMLPRRRPPSAPMPKRRVKSDEVAIEAVSLDGPEIVLMASESDDEGEDGPQIHVVPVDSASDSLMEALDEFDGFVGSKAEERTSDRAPPKPTCVDCGVSLDPSVASCPNCGANR